METHQERIKIGISSCLLGHAVRFDGGHKHHSYITSTLGQYFEFVPFCPEAEIGLGIPREPIRLQWQDGAVHCVGTKTPSLDVTERLSDCADQQREWQRDLCGYIFKKDSPSCGMERVRLYRGTMPERVGRGIYAARILENFPNLPAEEEGRLGDPQLRENFVQRVFVVSRWKRMLEEGLAPKGLSDFHARHKLIIMSHDQNAARELGRLVAGADSENLNTVAEDYLALLMKTLKVIATPGNHVNVLQHIQGYLKKHLDRDDKQELSETIARYQRGELPLIVPITLLRHHFRRNPDPYIENSLYMAPHPQELCLLNTL